MDHHSIHFHGHYWWVTETDGGVIPESARWPETTVNEKPADTLAETASADDLGFIPDAEPKSSSPVKHQHG